VKQAFIRSFNKDAPATNFRTCLTIVEGLAEGMGRRGDHLEAYLQTLANLDRDFDVTVTRFFSQTINWAVDPLTGPADRLAAIRMLAYANSERSRAALVKVLGDNPSQEIHLAAVRSVANHSQPEVADLLMKPWPSYTPAIRREVTEAMFRNPARINFLLDQIEKKHVKPGDLDSLRTRQLIQHADAKIRERAKLLLQDNLPADRKLVLARYQESLSLKGDPAKGRDIFKKNCATCHRVAGIGIDVGPDIADSRTKTPAALLVDILNPNQAIDNNYVNYLVTTKAGKSLSGIIVAESAASVTLRRAEGQSDTVLRQEIDEIRSTGVSLMPEGLEKTISVPEMADLLNFLKNWRYLDGAVPLE
jgi:putative heme-binding domain-containing protein